MPVIAVEEPRPELFLEHANLLAERRLRHVQTHGGTAEMQLLGQHDEIADAA